MRSGQSHAIKGKEKEKPLKSSIFTTNFNKAALSNGTMRAHLKYCLKNHHFNNGDCYGIFFLKKKKTILH